MTDTVLLDVDDGVGTLTLNRPDAMNALDAALTGNFIARAAEVEADSSIRCVVLRGAGDAFQAGGDIKAFHGWIDREPEQRRVEIHKMIHDMHPTVMILRRMPKPVVASVHGAAAGFGA
jgi:2-(1,2-epoxy-1,2-dihydrophenyl)acetyl-CoA isomerase